MPCVRCVETGTPFVTINELLIGCETLLDVGAGTGGSIAAMQVPVMLGLEVYRPYLELWQPTERITLPLNLPAKSLSRAFLPKTVDAVTFIDSLEHLDRAQAYLSLSDAETIARRIVVVMTPRGFFPQRGYDAWGLGGEHYQEHRSGWEPEDFTALGYDVLIFTGFHTDTNESFRRAFGPGAPPVDALVAYKRMREDSSGASSAER